MLGLIIKDFKLLKLQKNFVFIMISVVFILLITGLDITFMISYLTFINTFLVISTVGYDEYNKSNSFLMTLPISRKDYVIEKYSLGLMICLGVWVVMTILCTIYKVSMESQFNIFEWIGTCYILLCFPLLSYAFMLPIQLKYGGEKGRIAFIVLVGICFAVVFLIIQLMNLFNININNFIYDLSGTVIVVALTAIIIIGLLISYFISLKIMNNKEF